MPLVPFNWDGEAVVLCAFFEEFPVMAPPPIPSIKDIFTELDAEPVGLVAVDARYEVYREPELVRTLPRERFGGALSKEVQLPFRAAECLEDMERGLRAAGFMSGKQKLRQSFDDWRKFRVQCVDISNDHSSSKSVTIDRTAVFDAYVAKGKARASNSAVGPSFAEPPPSLVARRRRREAGT